MEKYHILTKEEIINKLKAMEVGEGKEMPVKIFHFLTPNPYYDPNTFSQEIEDSEEPVNIIEEIKKETSKPEFDCVWNNTISNINKYGHTQAITIMKIVMIMRRVWHFYICLSNFRTRKFLFF